MPDDPPTAPRSRLIGLPAARAARLSVLAPLVMIAGATVPMLIAGITGEGGDEWPLALTILAVVSLIGGGIVAVLGGVVAVRAIIRGERSLLLLVPIAGAVFALFFAGGELLFPH